MMSTAAKKKITTRFVAGYRELDQRAVRKAVGVSADIVEEAVAGESLAPELIGRLVGFLEQQQPPSYHQTAGAVHGDPASSRVADTALVLLSRHGCIAVRPSRRLHARAIL